MTTNERRMLDMLKRILRCMIIGQDLPGQFAIADLIEDVERSEEDEQVQSDDQGNL